MFMLWHEMLKNILMKWKKCDVWHAQTNMDSGKSHEPKI